MPNRRRPAELKGRVLAEASVGVPYRELERRYGVSDTQIARWLLSHDPEHEVRPVPFTAYDQAVERATTERLRELQAEIVAFGESGTHPEVADTSPLAVFEFYGTLIERLLTRRALHLRREARRRDRGIGGRGTPGPPQRGAP